jgi:hypothetical protein
LTQWGIVRTIPFSTDLDCLALGGGGGRGAVETIVIAAPTLSIDGRLSVDGGGGGRFGASGAPDATGSSVNGPAGWDSDNPGKGAGGGDVGSSSSRFYFSTGPKGCEAFSSSAVSCLFHPLRSAPAAE